MSEDAPATMAEAMNERQPHNAVDGLVSAALLAGNLRRIRGDGDGSPAPSTPAPPQRGASTERTR
jgi:hypothetical protein